MYRIFSTYNHQTRDQSKARQNRKYHWYVVLPWNGTFMLEQELAWKSIYYDQRGCSYFIFFFQAKPFLESTHWVTYGISNLSRRREFFMCPGRSEVRLASPLPFSVLGPWKNKETRNQKERRKIGPCFPREAAFSQASSLLLLVDCSMTGFPLSWALLARLRSDPASNNWKTIFPCLH